MKYSALEYRDYVYFFRKEDYYRYNNVQKRVDKGPVKISRGWKGVPTSFTACYTIKNMAYFFNGDEFITYDLLGDRTIATQKISEIWKIPFKTVNGVINCPGKDWMYFFHDKFYCRYDRKLGCVDTEKPADISEWKGMWEDGFDSVAMISSKPYFFRGNKCMAFNLDTKEKEGQLERIHDKWSGVPMLFKHSEEFEHKCECCGPNCYGNNDGHIGVRCWDRPICCRGVPKKYLCCGKEFVKGHESLTKAKNKDKRIANHPGKLESACPKYCQCPPNCDGGHPGAPKCRDRPICCRGWPKHYSCCGKHYGTYGCSFDHSLQEESVHEYKNVYIISDVHLTYDCFSDPTQMKEIKEKEKTEDKKEEENRKRVIIDKVVKFVKWLIETEENSELVLLGDIFDVWYAPTMEPIEPQTGDDYLGELLSRNEQEIKKAERLITSDQPRSRIQDVIDILNRFTEPGNRLVYVSGNHDDLIQENSLKKHLPKLCYYRDFYVSGNSCFTHGNVFDLYNRVFPGYPIPLGRYVTRCGCTYGATDIPKIFAGILQSQYMRSIYNSAATDWIAEFFFNSTFKGACKDFSGYKDVEVVVGKDHVMKIRDIIQNYIDLPDSAKEYYSKRGIKHGLGLSIQGSAGNMDLWAQWCLAIYNVDYVFMGHSHQVLYAEDKKKGKYLNSGQFPIVIKATRNGGKIEKAEIKLFNDENKLGKTDIEKSSLGSWSDWFYRPNMDSLDFYPVTYVRKDEFIDKLLIESSYSKTLPLLVTCQKEYRENYCLIEEKEEATGENKYNAQIVCKKCKDIIVPYGNPVSTKENAKKLAISRLIERALVYPDIQALIIRKDTTIQDVTLIENEFLKEGVAVPPSAGRPEGLVMAASAQVSAPMRITPEDLAKMKRVKRLVRVTRKERVTENFVKTMMDLKHGNYFEIRQVRFQLLWDTKVIFLSFKELDAIPYRNPNPLPKGRSEGRD
eukprot:TRINITY_DN431_c0_g1_i3.p1 TRINITY_DN431_c0_g1~~TRINITY_DN431_c0_g1_i3.p1  ORF type:complete len:960 (+),score=79.73 TRINITY_DN431_c0_g1_i3:398-3277(+)